MRSQAYRSLRNFTRFYMGKEKNKNVPAVTEIPSPAARGYLWRLSTKRMVYTHDWKRKYFVLTGDKLYYYDNELGDGSGAGAGIIHLDCFIDCVEAPLTDHKKATNVFILLAKERGLFEQGRYYLSAETLIDMKNWVSRIRAAIRSINRMKEAKPGDTGGPSLGPAKMEAACNEPEYASIKDYPRLHRSNSMSTLPSLCREEANERLRCLNRSMHEDIDHNLTYSYSSSEDSLNESFSINFTPKKPRSAGVGLRTVASPLYATPTKVRQEISLSSPLSHGSRIVPSTSSTPNSKGAGSSTPNKPIDTSAYLQKMYADMEKVDKQLELVAKIESKKADIAKFDEEEDEEMEYSDTMEVDITKEMALGENDDKLRKMEDMMKDLNQQSEEIHKMFRKLTAKRHSVGSVAAPALSPGDKEEQMLMAGFMESLAKYQDVMRQLQTQAKLLMMEIKTTHSKVVQSLKESQLAKKNFLELKQKAEMILGQLQEEARQAGHPGHQAPGLENTQVPLYATVRKDRTRAKGKIARNTVVEATEPPEDSPYQLRPRSLMMSYKH